MKLTPGSRLKSSVCTTEIIVVKAPEDDINLTCGGAAMITPDEDADTAPEISDSAKGGTLLGKRYVNEDETLEILCNKAGDGSLGIGDALLNEKEAKSLPASD